MIEKLKNRDALSTTEIWQIAYYIENTLTPTEFLEGIFNSISIDELKNCLSYIVKEYNIKNEEF